MIERIVSLIIGTIIGFIIKWFQDYQKMKKIQHLEEENLKLSAFIKQENLKQKLDEFYGKLQNMSDEEKKKFLEDLFK